MSPRSGALTVQRRPQTPSRPSRASNKINIILLALGDENLERFFWQFINPTGFQPKDWSYSFHFPALSPKDNKLTVSIFGNSRSIIYPDHHVKIYLNNSLVEDVWWDDINWQLLEIDLPNGILMPGNNTLRIECPNDTGVGNELVYLDWFKSEYRHPFTAVDHQLHFEQKEPGQWNYSIDHFSSDQIAVYDISNPQAVEKISGFLTTPTANGFAAQFQDDLTTPNQTYWAGEEAAHLSAVPHPAGFTFRSARHHQRR